MENPILEKKVLVVDDEVSIRTVLARYFRRRGFEVFQASSGKEALDLFTEHQPHIVLLDILMPGENGLEILSELKKLSPSVKVVMVSAVRDEGVFKKCLELGAMDYVIKPFELLDLDVRIMGKLLQ